MVLISENGLTFSFVRSGGIGGLVADRKAITTGWTRNTPEGAIPPLLPHKAREILILLPRTLRAGGMTPEWVPYVRRGLYRVPLPPGGCHRGNFLPEERSSVVSMRGTIPPWFQVRKSPPWAMPSLGGARRTWRSDAPRRDLQRSRASRSTPRG